MRRTLILTLLFLNPAASHAFLNSSDPQNIFSILAKAPMVARVKAVASAPPSPKQSYFLQEWKVESVLSGTLVESKLKVLQERLVPQDRAALPVGASGLVALAPLPNYTAYAAARQQGAAYRIFGGNAGAVILDGEGEELLNWSEEFFKAKGDQGLTTSLYQNFLRRAFDLKSPRWVNEAALAFGELSLPMNALDAAQVGRIAALFQDARVQPPAQIALINALQQSGTGPALEALKTLAEGSNAPAKWAAIRALEELGIQRSPAQLKADFNAADEAGKLRALAAAVRQRGPEAAPFLREVLNGPQSPAVKREAIDSMARVGGAGFEGILIDQLENGDLQVATQAILALGRMQSANAVPRLIRLIDSASPQLRSAAILALQQSNDPRARQSLEEKLPRTGEGHLH